jgi:hypothetical protein
MRRRTESVCVALQEQATVVQSATADRAAPGATPRPPQEQLSRRPIQATRSQAESAKRARSCSMISACRWHTRDSLTPRTVPIAAMVSFS